MADERCTCIDITMAAHFWYDDDAPPLQCRHSSDFHNWQLALTPLTLLFADDLRANAHRKSPLI